MATQFVRYPKESSSAAAPIQFVLNSANTQVNKDTVTPANNKPLPVQLLDTSGNINQVSVSSSALPTGAATESTLSTLNGKIPSNLTVTSTRLLVDGSGVTQPISAASLPLPTGAATETTLSGMSGKLPSTIGQKAMSASLAVVLASDQSSIPVTLTSTTITGTVAATQSGTWNVGINAGSNVMGKVSLQVGGSDVSTSNPLPIGPPLSGALAVSQSGTWNISNVSGTISLPTGASTSALQTTANSSLSSIDGKFGSLGQKAMTGSAPVVIASDQSAIATKSGGSTVVNKSRNDYTSTSVTTSAYVQVLASTSSAISAIEIFDSSGQTLVLATGGAGSEVDQMYILPGGNGRIPFTIAASTRVSIKAVSGTASVGENTINYYSA